MYVRHHHRRPSLKPDPLRWSGEHPRAAALPALLAHVHVLPLHLVIVLVGGNVSFLWKANGQTYIIFDLSF